MTTFGSFPGVQVTTAGGGVTGVDVGSEEKLVIFGNGDAGAGSASVNDPTQIGARRDADTKFGDGTELANAMKDALANGANINFLYGVMVDEVTASTETFSGTATGTLSNVPLVEDTSVISVTDTVESASVSVEFRYTSPPPAPTDPNTMFINPFTGEFEADESADYDIDYDYLDWSSAFDSADNVVSEDETGVYVALSEAESVANSLQGTVTTLRSNYQMVKGLAGAEPNANSADNDPEYNTSAYTDAVDSDDTFLFAPVRQKDSVETVLGGVGGLFAGNAINNPVYNEPLSGFTDLEQKINKTDEDNLEAEQVIPIRQAGSIRVKRNLSTSTETDWERDFWRRRIVDRAILIAKTVGDNTIGAINLPETRESAQDIIENELISMVNDNLIQPNTSDEQRWFVDVYEDDTDTDEVNIDIGITPYGIVKRVDASVTIDT